MGFGMLPACLTEEGVDACKRVGSASLHGDHRFGRGVLLSWELVGERRTWTDRGTPVHQAGRAHAAIGLGWHKEWEWGDMRPYGGPALEVSRAGRSTLGDREVGMAFLDPQGEIRGWTGVGLWIGNDLDWPVGDVRLGFRWRIKADADIDAHGVDGIPDAIAGVDMWELHAASIAVPVEGPVGFYAEVGWVNQFSVPFRAPAFRVSPWATLGLQFRGGRTR
jgi:hypothetical protein